MWVGCCISLVNRKVQTKTIRLLLHIHLINKIQVMIPSIEEYKCHQDLLSIAPGGL